MLKNKLKYLLIKAALVFTLTISVLIPNLGVHKTYANPNVNNIQQVQQIKQEYDVLIYHSHTHEDFKDGSTIVDAGNDLASKLEKKGLRVKVVNDIFDSNYNRSYYASREFLKTELQINSYKLMIDMHRDSIAGDKVVTGIDDNGNPISKTMFVVTTDSPNYQENKKVVDELKNSIDKFGKDMTRNHWEYRKGTSFFNSDIGNKDGNGNVILIEQGFQTNDSLSVRRSNTYLCSAIAQYINDNFKN